MTSKNGHLGETGGLNEIKLTSSLACNDLPQCFNQYHRVSMNNYSKKSIRWLNWVVTLKPVYS